jgi:hypothetical protein
VVSLRVARLLAGVTGGSANEDLSHLSNLLSTGDERSIEQQPLPALYRDRTASEQSWNVRKSRLILIPALAFALAGCGQGGGPASSRSTPTREPSGSGVAMTHTCSTSSLAVWLGLGEGGAAAGSTYYPLELTNVSSRRCRLFGFPGVSAVGEHQLGAAAARDRSRPARSITLLPGTTAHTVLRIADVANFPATRCRPVDASGLRVYPPDQRAAAEIPFSFRACSATGPIFLSVEPIQPGVGVPGFPS